MVIETGAQLPDVSFMVMGAEGPTQVSSSEVFGGKRVALFGLPGAYTPVYSARHLPGFVAQAGALCAKGFDSIVCLSVNDPFVMDAWGKDNQAEGKIMILADNECAFTRATDLAVDLSAFGLGERTQRFSMIVDDGVVTAINVEESVLYLGISSAETLLEQA